MNRKITIKALLLMLGCLLIVAGCARNPGNEIGSQKVTIKVMYHDEESFFSQYGNLFAMKHPDIDIQVVSSRLLQQYDASAEEWAAFLEQEQPDVLLLNTSRFEQLAADGKLTELEPLIKRDRYSMETFFPNLIELLKEKGQGKLYGLTPTFQSSVIYYNEDLFAKYGVELPHDGMTWQDIIDTARRFPVDEDGETRIYGYGAAWPLSWMDWVYTISPTYGLTMQNSATQKLTINTAGWKTVLQLALDGWESGVVYNDVNTKLSSDRSGDYYQRQLFLMGRVAMTSGDPALLSDMKVVQDTVEGIKPFKVGMVAGPVDPAVPDQTRDIWLGGIFSLHAGSPNTDEAWEFMKFVHGEDYARIKSRTLNHNLLSRMNDSMDAQGYNLEAFYKLKPLLGSSVMMENVPPGFNERFWELFDSEVTFVREKKKTLDEALLTIETEGQAIWDQAAKEEELRKEKEKEKEKEGE